MDRNIKRETIYLYLVQLSNTVLPLVMVPYLAHVLGLEFFGKLSYAQAVSYICIFVVDFGFNFSAARSVGVNADKNAGVNKIYSNVQTIKIVIFICLISVLILSSFIMNLSIIDRKLLILGGISSISSIVMPVWLFQGMGRNSSVAILNLVMRVISLSCILIFVNSKDDLLLASALQLLSPCLAGVLMQGFIIKKQIAEFNFHAVTRKDLSSITKESFHNFSASFLTLGFTYFNPIFVKFFLGDAALGLYSFADKLANVLRQFYVPLTQACFSKICALFNQSKIQNIRRILLTVFLIFTSMTVIAYLGNLFLGELVIGSFFADARAVSHILMVMIITQGIISYSMILVNLIIIPAGHSSYLKQVYLKALVCYAIILYPLIKTFGIYGVASAIAVVELLVITLFWFFIRKEKLITVKL